MPNAFMDGFLKELTECTKTAGMPLAKKDVPAKEKEIYYAMKGRGPGKPAGKDLKERYGGRAKEVAARTAKKLRKRLARGGKD